MNYIAKILDRLEEVESRAKRDAARILRLERRLKTKSRK